MLFRSRRYPDRLMSAADISAIYFGNWARNFPADSSESVVKQNKELVFATSKLVREDKVRMVLREGEKMYHIQEAGVTAMWAAAAKAKAEQAACDSPAAANEDKLHLVSSTEAAKWLN